MRIITLLNEKGGVGKTTLAVTLASGLAIRGARVVLVDADAQANATLALGQVDAPGLYDLLVREHSFDETLVRIPDANFADQEARGELLLIRSNVETKNIANSLPDAIIVQERLADLDGWADYVVIDTSPSPDLFHSAILIATDAVVFPCICEMGALVGLTKSHSRLKTASNFRASVGKPPIEALGIVPTFYRSSTVLHGINLGKLRDEWGDLVWREVPQRVTWGEASQMQQSIFAYAPSSDAARDGWEIVDHVETAKVI
jgi:chromosome partitioning protein